MSTPANTKKKPDFNNLDLSKVVAPSNNKPSPAPIEGIDEVKKVLEGHWVRGESITEISPENFKQWLQEVLPGMGVEKWDLKTMSTPAERENYIFKVIELFRVINLKVQRGPEKKYLN